MPTYDAEHIRDMLEANGLTYPANRDSVFGIICAAIALSATPPSPNADEYTKYRRSQILRAGLLSGHEGTFVLACQLAGVPACEKCRYRKEYCICDKPVLVQVYEWSADYRCPKCREIFNVADDSEHACLAHRGHKCRDML